MGFVVVPILIVVVALVTVFVLLTRSRDRVMDYHGIETPQINEMTRGGGGGDG